VLSCQHLVNVGLADGETSTGKGGVADQIHLGVVMGKLNMESEVFKRFVLIHSIKQRYDAKEQTAGGSGG
jgi:hypothetical protein